MDTTRLLTALEQNLELTRTEAKIVVVGLGATGVSVARFLHGLDFKFAVVDSRDKPPMVEKLSETMPDVPVFSGGFDQNALDVATHLIVSPGVALNELAINRVISTGVKVLSDIDLFACVSTEPVLAITGSNGKSTVTTMLGAMGHAAGIKTAIGGNLGTPALDLFNQEAELYALELSSFQLERTHCLNALAATVLNVSADHLDRHPGIDAYAAAKQRVFAGNGVMVLNEDDPVVLAMRANDRKTLTFSVAGKADFWLDQGSGNLMHADRILMHKSQLPLEGLHNIANALAAMALGSVAGMPAPQMCQALATFTGLEHRMQKAGVVNGVSYINDSKATNIGACIAALQGYQQPVILIAGGDGKGADMQELAPIINQKTKAVIVMGKDAQRIADVVDDALPVRFAGNMKEAVKLAAAEAMPGDTVLLSPACASLDQYQNYMERGNRFMVAVKGLKK